jgi:hypothetical protein
MVGYMTASERLLKWPGNSVAISTLRSRVKAMRARGDRRPFILYTVFSSDVQRKLVADSGGQGVAETPDELYAAILPLFKDEPD